MDYSLREALNIGVARQGAAQEQKNIGDLLFKNLRDKANINTLRAARDNKIGSSYGIADYDTGLLTVPGNSENTFRELEKVTDKYDIARKLTKGYPVDSDKIAESGDKFYSGQWFVINPSDRTSKPNWDDAVDENREDVFKTKLPGVERRTKGIKFGSEEDRGIKVLFRIPKIRELE